MEEARGERSSVRSFDGARHEHFLLFVFQQTSM